ncbi:hypothetical protein [Longimicrobium sp.]|uniref:hypothetical protein n=1 Tax=Longimicrobium sp. TaxID=2029185 RepID=UPI002C2FA3C8|nr:hypothetical protein [Longimicrobium sp.]HSU13946.1 hypothetical protein [Longimicrobium sp.]
MEDVLYVILIVIIVLVVIVVVLALVSYALGVWYSFTIPKSDPVPPGGTTPPADKPCSQCDRDKAWYAAQPGWKQVAVAVWWAADRSACAAKGCS